MQVSNGLQFVHIVSIQIRIADFFFKLKKQEKLTAQFAKQKVCRKAYIFLKYFKVIHFIVSMQQRFFKNTFFRFYNVNFKFFGKFSQYLSKSTYQKSLWLCQSQIPKEDFLLKTFPTKFAHLKFFDFLKLNKSKGKVIKSASNRL